MSHLWLDRLLPTVAVEGQAEPAPSDDEGPEPDEPELVRTAP